MKWIRKFVHSGELPAHITYLTAVAFDIPHVHAIAAGVLAIILIIAAFIGQFGGDA